SGKERRSRPLQGPHRNAGPTPLLGRHEHDAGRVEEEGPAIEPAEELHPGPALGPQHAEQLVSRVQADLDPAEVTPGGLEPPVHLDPARADVEAVFHARGALGEPPRLLRGPAVEARVAVPRFRVSSTKAPPGLRAVQNRSMRSRSSSSVKNPMLEKRLRARSNSPEKSMSRMSCRTSWRVTAAAAARSFARRSSVSERST